jgi:hypothetical protein
VWVRRLYTSADGRDLVAMDSRRRVFGGMLRRMLVLRDDVCTTPWCEAPIVHADHATPVREHGGTSFTEGNGKCTRCNHGKEAPGWRTRVILGGADRGTFCRDGGSDSDHSSSRGNRGFGDQASDGDGLRARRVVQVTTPLGHTYDAEPPPLLGWGSQTFPPATAVPARLEKAGTTGGGRAHSSAADPSEVPPGSTGAPDVSDVSGGDRAPAGHGGSTEPKSDLVSTPSMKAPSAPKPTPDGTLEAASRPAPTRQTRTRPAAQATGGPGPVQRRKRALRRPRTLSCTPTAAGSRHARRPRLTSHLERQLCRYLT